MIDTSIAIAAQRADQLRQEIAEIAFIASAASFHITVSIGIAAYPEHGEKLRGNFPRCRFFPLSGKSAGEKLHHDCPHGRTITLWRRTTGKHIIIW